MPYGLGTENKNGTLNETGRKIERCVNRLVNDPSFKPKNGQDKKAVAIAVCKASIMRADEIGKQLEK